MAGYQCRQRYRHA